MLRADCVMPGNESIAVSEAVEARETAFLKAFTVRYYNYASQLLDAIRAMDIAMVYFAFIHMKAKTSS